MLTRGRALGTLAALGAVTLLAVLVAPWIGATRLEFDAVWAGLGFPAANRDASIFLVARLPRILGAILAGLSLGIAGATLQGLLRNPLADPYTLGVSGGASAAAALVMAFGLDSVLPAGLILPAAALAGALLAMASVERLGRIVGHTSPGALLLAGIVVSVLCSSVILLLQQVGDPTTSPRMLRWMLGSLDLARYDVLLVAAPLALGAAGFLVAHSGALNLLALGDEAALGLGLDVPREVRALHRGTSILTGAAVAAVGPVAFTGLLAPHVARRLLGSDHRLLVPASGLVGVLLLLVCDTASRTVFTAGEPPVGLWTALLGGPTFLAVLLRTRRHASL